MGGVPGIMTIVSYTSVIIVTQVGGRDVQSCFALRSSDISGGVTGFTTTGEYPADFDFSDDLVNSTNHVHTFSYKFNSCIWYDRS